MTLRDTTPRMTAAQLEAFLDEVFPQLHSGGRTYFVEEVGPMTARMRCDYHEKHLRPGGTISGPTMMALADVALRERHFGIKGTRQAFLAKKGFHYAAGSSDCTLNKLKKDYTVYHGGKPVVIGGHISKGVKARRLLRIYFAWLPESKAFLIGHVGEHLPTETHSH